MRKIIWLALVFFLVGFSNSSAQVLTGILGKGEVQFVSGFMSIQREMKFTSLEVDEEDLTPAQVDAVNKVTSYKVKNSSFYLGMNFGFSSNIQLHMGVGVNSYKFNWDGKSPKNLDKDFKIPSKRIEVALVRFGLGGGYEFPMGILVAEQSYITLGSLPDMDNLPYFRQKDMGYWGEWEVALSGGYRIKFSPLVNTLPYVGMVYTSRYEFLKGESPANNSAKLEWGVLGKDKFGGVVGLSFNCKKWEARFEADIGTRRFFIAQVGVKI
jgi:hypothetical protein